MCSHLTVLPPQQSLELWGYLRYSLHAMPFELSFSNFLCHNTKLTIPEVHVCTCTEDYTICILLFKDTLLLSSYSTLGIWRLRAVSIHGSLANCWKTQYTQSVHYKMIPLLIIHMCGHIHASPTHTLTYYSCRGQPSELDVPWSDMQRIGSLSWDSFFVSCWTLRICIAAASSRSSWRMIHNISLVLSCLDSSTLSKQIRFDWSSLSSWRKCNMTQSHKTYIVFTTIALVPSIHTHTILDRFLFRNV